MKTKMPSSLKCYTTMPSANSNSNSNSSSNSNRSKNSNSNGNSNTQKQQRLTATAIEPHNNRKMAAIARRRQPVVALLIILLLLVANSNSTGQAQAAPATVTATAPATHQLQIGVEGDMPKLIVTTKQQQQQQQHSITTTTATTTTTAATTAGTTAATVAVVNDTSDQTPELSTTVLPVKIVPTTTTTEAAATAATTTAAPANAETRTTALPANKVATISTAATETPGDSSNTLHLSHLPHRLESVVQLLDLEGTVAPPLNNGHDGRKLTKKKQLQQQQYPKAAASTAATTTTAATTKIETTTSSNLASSQPTELLPVPNGYLGPIFMGEKTFSVVHPLKKPLAPNQQPSPEDSIEQQLRQGRIVEILAPTALLELNVETSSLGPGTTRTTTLLPAAPPVQPQSVLSTTVFQVPEVQVSTTRLPMAAAEISVAGSVVLAAPPRTESKISDIQIEVYDSTVDSIVASTNFRDNSGYYLMPLEPGVGTTKPPSSPVVQERFTQYVIDRADVSTQPAAGNALGKPEPAAIEIHINVSEAFGNESEDLEFSYRQPPASERKSNNPNDEILVVEIIDNGAGDNNTENSFSASAEHMNLNSMFNYPYRSDARPPAVRPPQDAADELFMADTKGGLPRPPPPPPPPPMPRKPSIDRDSDTIFYISNTEVKVGESLPTTSSAINTEQQQQRKIQFENQFFPASYMLEQEQQQQQQQQQQQEDIILSPLHHSADAMKILRPSGGISNGDDAPPLDVTYVGESVIEVEQQSLPSTGSSTHSPPLILASSQLPDIIIQPAVLPDLAIGVPVIGELPPQIELKEIDYMPGELMGQGRSIYENDIDSNGLGMGSDPDVLESSIQYGGDLIDDGAGGGFDGVEGSYPFESPAHRQKQQQQDENQQQAKHGLYRQSLNHGYSHLHREQLPVAELLNATLQQRNESLKPGLNVGDTSAMAPLLRNQLPERMVNATPLSEDSLAEYDGYLNLFAVSMGLIIVILPAALLTSMYCAVRYLLNKNANSNATGDDSEQGQGPDSKNESSSCCSVASSATPSSQMDNPKANLYPNPNPDPNPNAALIRSMSLALASGVQRIEFQFEARPDIQTPNSIDTLTPTSGGGAFAFSGSVTKMTLKDNHLIVVTEERHDISRNARETKMHTDKDGVFVVEVARGIDSKQLPDSPAAGTDITELPFDTSSKLAVTEERSLPPGHEQVQIHAPPSDFVNPLPVGTVGSVAAVGLQLIEEEQPDEEPLPIMSQTGLSQSDLSSTSSSDSNKRYSYGNQELYVIEQPGYAGNSPLVLHSQLLVGQETTDMEQKDQLKSESQSEQLVAEEQPLPAPAAFGNANVVEGKEEAETDKEIEKEQSPLEQEQEEEQEKKIQLDVHNEEQPEKLEQPMLVEPENTYDSLMSLPAPPSNEEIKELNDFTLIETNQLDSLPPPPPPPPLTEAQNGNHSDKQEQEQKEEEEEEEKQQQQEQLKIQIAARNEPNAAIKLTYGNVNGKINGSIANSNSNSKHPPGGTAATNGGGEEPSTLTPPASPPASPVASGASTLCAGSLSNGIHAVAVNGS
ncbi:GH24645 [Drosophila grimshawi]|uniref:GH24645 n=1 Tax=Drosophila grimshawi TaxID=7222 RepID=B4JMK9_DROGR|nr:GH24645 [Drosophila grimshawi]